LPCPTPLPNESREDYCIRAHRATMQEIPDPNARNREVWSACDQYFGDPERERAEAFFPPDQFEHKRDMCLWFEHETEVQGPDGPMVRKNDVNRIRDIVRENNMRIANTDAYSAIVDKHTTAPNQPVPAGHTPSPSPKTIGFAGPYRIGMIGRIEPKFALFADEHRRRDAAEVFRDRPRRSVEVLTLRANGRSYIDPIAALSEAPRLPLPVQYHPGEGGFIERYQADPVYADTERYEGALPGGSNTFIAGGFEKKRFDALSDEQQSQQPESGSMSLGPEDLNQIITALLSTPQMKFIEQMMQEKGMGGDMGGDPNGQPPAADPMGGQMPPSAPTAGPPSPGSQPPAAGSPAPPAKEPYIAPMLAAGAGMMAGQAMSSQNSAMANRYSAGHGDYERELDEEEMTEQYAALAESHKNTLEEVAALRRIVADLKMSEADATRKMRISGLASKYPHMVDASDLENRCLYSAGSTMSDSEFDNHIEIVETYSAKAPGITTSTPMVPGGEMPHSVKSQTVEQAKYEADLTEKMIEIYSASLATGKPMKEADAWAAAREVIAQ
jgi:hypothetical protein